MLTFSTDPVAAEQQMRAIIFYLTTFGYVDGEFDAAERSFVRDYIQRLVVSRVKGAAVDLREEVQQELVDRYTHHFHEVFEGIDEEVAELFTEAVARDEDHARFVNSKLKLRCFEIFQAFDRPSQEALMKAIDELLMADGQAHPAEVQFRAELAGLLDQELDIEVEAAERGRSTNVGEPESRPAQEDQHPFFEGLEHHYSADPDKIARQFAADRDVLRRARTVLDALRAKGQGRLTGVETVADVPPGEPILDGHVYAMSATPGVRYELVVLGDLHGCYSCLKGAVMQSRFFAKVRAYKEDPANNPYPALVLLGDYINRGIFSLNGVLRGALTLLCTAPEHVFVLRGNHEYFVEYKGSVYGGVKPSEAIDTLKPHVPAEVFTDYIALFDSLPSLLLFDRTMFVHAGIPRDNVFRECFEDLSSLNDPKMRFQMMWSDPSSADVIPEQLQEQTARFPFGRLQARRFLQKIGCDTLVRGHEKVNAGFKRVYDEDSMLLVTLFSAGGHDNDDLPSNSSYRRVTPMAATLVHDQGKNMLTPWPIDYAPFNDPDRNAFFRSAPELRHGG